MKTSTVCLSLILILALSCTKSRFATTTRHVNGGKVTYTNHYSNEKRNLKLQRVKHSLLTVPDASANNAGLPLTGRDTSPVMNLVASAGHDILIYNNGEEQNSPYISGVNSESPHDITLIQPVKTQDASTRTMAKVSSKQNQTPLQDTIKTKDNQKGNKAGTKGTKKQKTETLGIIGFIFSLLGLVPVFGVPFALMAIIFGANSLKRIKRNPKKYKGKELAMASIVIGSLMLLINIIILIVSIANAPAPHVHSTSSTTCKV